MGDDQRDAFVCHLVGVRVPELVRREAPTHASVRGVGEAPARAAALDHGRPRVAVDDGNSGPTGV